MLNNQDFARMRASCLGGSDIGAVLGLNRYRSAVDVWMVFGRPVIATNDAYRFMAESQAREVGVEIDILVEPSRRDSGPAMAAAAAYTRRLGAKAVLALASDHLVIGAEEFLAGCREGLAAVQQGGIVTFGIPPTEPKTDYGYIRPGAERIGTVIAEDAHGNIAGARYVGRVDGCEEPRQRGGFGHRRFHHQRHGQRQGGQRGRRHW